MAKLNMYRYGHSGPCTTTKDVVSVSNAIGFLESQRIEVCASYWKNF